jgi:hypothetical protein
VYRFPWGTLAWLDRHPEAAHLAPAAPGPGDPFPDFRGSILDRDKDTKALGLDPAARFFNLADLKFAVLVVELLHEDCLACQDRIPVYNQLARWLKTDPGIAAQAGMLGIGSGSSLRSAARFRKTHQPAFPVFADPDRSLFRALGSPVLPTLFVLTRNDSSAWTIRQKSEEDAQPVEDLIREVNGLNTSGKKD